MDTPQWPKLLTDSWTDTRETFHMWTQIVGKIQMVGTPLVNHWWNVTFDVTARGLGTRLIPYHGRGFDMEFDFLDQQLVLRCTDGGRATVALEPKTVADFFAETLDALKKLDVGAEIIPAPNEVEPAIPFAEDTEHKSYDAEAMRTFWAQLVQINRVFEYYRAWFVGKASPVQLFWGSLDLSVTRYSGRGAPPHTGSVPNCAPFVMQEAESRENAAAGFWAGGTEGMFYAYVYPVPDGYADAKVQPDGAHYDAELGEFVMPYEVVRESADPDATLLAFLDSTYAAAADLGRWDRKMLEENPDRLDRYIRTERAELKKHPL